MKEPLPLGRTVLKRIEKLLLTEVRPDQHCELLLARKELLALCEMLLPELPGMPAVESPKARGTIEEVTGFVKSLGLPVSDATWFYFKMEGCGWKNGGKAVKDWRSTIRCWQISGYMASQQQARRAEFQRGRHNGDGDPRSLGQRVTDGIVKRTSDLI